MNKQSDLEYYGSRARAERELSAGATDPVAASIHRKLAECYENLLGEFPASRPNLRLITA
jgi:hypothetical protein